MNEEQRKQIHVVLDLETMGICHDAAIIKIGLVIFNHDRPGNMPNLLEEWSKCVYLNSSQYHGGTVNAETIKWWVDIDRSEARDSWLGNQKEPITTVLNEVACIFGKYSTIEPLPLIWGNGVNFDNAILKSAYERLGVKVPWSYRQDTDFRTLKLLYRNVVPEPAFVGTPHVALDDARHEAFWLSNILRYIYGEVNINPLPLDITKLPVERLSKD